MPSRMRPRPLATLAAAGSLASLVNCTTPPPGNAAGQTTPHTTAASGFGLGPEDFRSNGGAFGPDQLSH